MGSEEMQLFTAQGCEVQSFQTVSARLQKKRDALTAQLADVDAALSALREHPEVETVINLIGKTGRYL